MRTFILLFWALIFIGCEEEGATGGCTIEYKAESSPSGMDITIEKNGNTEQYTVKSSSWGSSQFDADEGEYVYVSAQANNKNAEVEVQILCDGNVFESASSKGDFVIASASGTIE